MSGPYESYICAAYGITALVLIGLVLRSLRAWNQIKAKGGNDA